MYYLRSAVEHFIQCGMHIYSGAYANSVKCMYVPVNTVDCRGFMGGIITGIEVSCGHELIYMCGLYMTFEGHISFLLCTWQYHDADGVINDTIAFGFFFG